MIAKIWQQKYKLFAISAIVLLGALIYSNTFYGAFHLDDIPSIVKNPAIKNITNLQAIWSFRPTRFITYLSLALNYDFSRLNVFSYHFVNLIVHLSCAILVWWLTLLSFSTLVLRGEKIAKDAKLIALFTALIFVAHPLQTQAVTYIIQRTTSLATLFYLAALCFYIKFRFLQPQGARKEAREFYYGALLMAMLAMFTKEMAVTLPFMILLYERSFLKTKEKINWKYLVPFFLLLAIIPLTLFLTKAVDFTSMSLIAEEPTRISFGEYLFTQFRVIVTYLRLLFVPINQNLDYYYPIAKNFFTLPIMASFFLLVAILIAAAKMFSKYRLMAFGIFWFFITLLPESSVIPIKDIIFEHRLYLPLAGFSIFLVSAIYYLCEKRTGKLMVVVMLVIISNYALLTYRRNFIWQDEFTLWNDVVRKSPQKARPYNNRGTIFYRQGNAALAIADFTQAIKIYPNYADAYYNRGTIFGKQGKFTQALADLTRAIAITPNDAEIYNNRGIVYYQQGKFAQAIANYSKAIEINPNFAYAYGNRGVAYYLSKEYAKAWADIHKTENLGHVVDVKFINALKQASGKLE